MTDWLAPRAAFSRTGWARHIYYLTRFAPLLLDSLLFARAEGSALKQHATQEATTPNQWSCVNYLPGSFLPGCTGGRCPPLNERLVLYVEALNQSFLKSISK
jgi:hypothetical protein